MIVQLHVSVLLLTKNNKDPSPKPITFFYLTKNNPKTFPQAQATTPKNKNKKNCSQLYKAFSI